LTPLYVALPLLPFSFPLSFSTHTLLSLLRSLFLSTQLCLFSPFYFTDFNGTSLRMSHSVQSLACFLFVSHTHRERRENERERERRRETGGGSVRSTSQPSLKKETRRDRPICDRSLFPSLSLSFPFLSFS
jgi:hypothetical protein